MPILSTNPYFTLIAKIAPSIYLSTYLSPFLLNLVYFTLFFLLCPSAFLQFESFFKRQTFLMSTSRDWIFRAKKICHKTQTSHSQPLSHSRPHTRSLSVTHDFTLTESDSRPRDCPPIKLKLCVHGSFSIN